MNTKGLFAVLVSIAWLQISCNPSPWYKNKFYNYATLNDYRRLPLVEPYELLNDGSGWEILYGGKLGSAYVDQIYVKKGEFIIGSGKRGNIQVGSDTIPRIIYFVMDVTKRQKDFFHKQERFDSILINKGVDRKDIIPVKQIDEIHTKYEKTGVLPWYNE